MSSFVNWSSGILELVLYESNGNMLEFFIGVKIGTKTFLKRFAFSQKPKVNLPLTNKDGIAGIFLL